MSGMQMRQLLELWRHFMNQQHFLCSCLAYALCATSQHFLRFSNDVTHPSTPSDMQTDALTYL